MIVTIEEATKLANKSRSTINRDLKKGKLSRVDGGIDTSELMRVYGALTHHDTPRDTSPDVSFNTHDTSGDTPKTEDDVSKAWLMRRIENLEEQVREKDALILASTEKLTLLLTHQKEQSNTKRDYLPIISGLIFAAVALVAGYFFIRYR